MGDLCDRDFGREINEKIKSFSKSNGSRYYTKSKVNIGFVGDEYTFHLFKDVANVIKLNATNFQETDQLNKFDFILIAPPTSFSLSRSSDNFYELFLDSTLAELFQFTKENGIKTVLYDMEASNPSIEYDHIIVRSDYIFTVQREKIGKIQHICQHKNVFEIGLGVNPLLHNPINRVLDNSRSDVLHIGSYKCYEEEIVDNFTEITTNLFDETIRPKIVDTDFNSGKNLSSFPLEYIGNTSPNIDFLRLSQMYKLFDWSIALNEFKFSETSISPIIYELLASGCNVLSNYNVHLNNRFPSVFIITNPEEAKLTIRSFTGKDKAQQQMAGVRMVLEQSTIFHQFAKILDTLGYEHSLIDRKVLVIAEKIDETIKDMFQKQTYKHKALMLANEVNDKILNDFDMITFFSSDREYEEFYLEDMINGFKYTDSDYITKNQYYQNDSLIPGLENNYTNKMNDKYATIFWGKSFTLKELLDIKQSVELENGYSIDRYEFNSERKSATQKLQKKKDYKLSLIVPIYNNGKYLMYKCFNSLKRSSMFNEMEILLVDDGSNDGFTSNMVNRLSRYYPNVRTFSFNDGGSGSASRPRNKGNELATAEYIAYLDPDNEAVNDGYKKLYDQIVNTEFDFVIGIMKTLSNTSELMAIYDEKQENDDPTALLIKNNFKPQSIQTLVIKKDFVLTNKLEMVIGSAGQDTLFFQELLINANKVKVTDVLVHLYFSAVDNSTVNSINKKYFHKVYLREVETNKRLSRYGLIDEYKKRRFERFFKLWYLKKLVKVIDTDIEESVKIIYDIYSIHKEGLELKDKRVKRFIMLYEKQQFDKLYNEFIYKLR